MFILMNIQKTSVCKIIFFRFLLCKVALVQVPVFTQCTFDLFLFFIVIILNVYFHGGRYLVFWSCYPL